jgi:hypothetical protein
VCIFKIDIFFFLLIRNIQSMISAFILFGLVYGSQANYTNWTCPSNSVEGRGRVLLAYVDTLTFREGHFTTGRRENSINHITCLGRSGCSLKPGVIQCKNKGSNGTDIQWECEAEMDYRYTFGKVHVICEGYDGKTDPYILENSCGLEFTLHRKFPKKRYPLGKFLNLIFLLLTLSTCVFSGQKRERYDFLLGVGAGYVASGLFRYSRAQRGFGGMEISREFGSTVRR